MRQVVPEIQCSALYDSERFTVTHIPLGTESGFEIVRKSEGTCTLAFLVGKAAREFTAQINAWQLRTPTQEDVELALEGLSELGANPLFMH